MAQKLSPEQIQGFLVGLSGWRHEGPIILKRYTFSSFPSAMLFVSAVAHLAEGVNHHPDILVQWKNVTLTISTHDSGGLTEKDFALARQIDALPLRTS